MSTFYPVAPIKEQIAQVQRVEVTGASVSSLAVTLPKGAPRVGSVIVLFVGVNSATVTISSITQSGVTWTSWMSKVGTGVSALAWLGVVTSAAPATLTIHLSASADISATATEWSGLNTQALTLATGAGNSGSGQAADSGPATVAAIASASGGTVTPQGLVLSALAVAAPASATINGPGINRFSVPDGGAGTSNVELAASWIDQVPPSPTYEYWVSPSGSDSNPGTQALPFFSLWGLYHVISYLDFTGTTGVVAHFVAGYHVWGSPSTTWRAGNTTASAAAPVRLVADVPGKTFIISAAGMSDISMNYVSLEGFTILTQHYLAAHTYLSSATIQINGNYSVVQDCAWPSNLTEPAVEATGQWNVIRRCSITGYAGVTSATSGYPPISVAGNYAQVTNNLLVGVLGVGIVAYVASGGIGQHIITNNTICNVIPLSGVTSQFGLSVPMSAGIVVGCGGGTSDYSIIANNIIRDVNVGIKEFVTSPGVMGSHNLYRNNDVYNAATAAYQFLTGAQTGGLASDPLFVNYQTNGSGDYHLNTGSPCIDAGVSAGAPDDDYDGNARPAGGAYDIGCYEYASAASATYRGVWAVASTTANWAAVIGVLAPLVIPPSSGFNGYYRAVTRQEGASVYYRMNEPAGALNFADNALPSTGAGPAALPSASGVLSGYGGLLASDPATAGAALFDGASGYVTTPYTPGALGAFSARGWLSWDGIAAVGSTPRIFSTGQVSSLHSGFEVFLTPGSNESAVTLTAAAGNGTTSASVTTSAPIPALYTRTQVFLTYDGATLAFYLNGALAGTAALAGPLGAAAHALVIGARPTGGSPADYFAGLIQDVAIFPTALTAAQVLSDYIAGVRGPAQQQSPASQYGYKQQLVLVYSPTGQFIDVWRDAPLLAGVKYALNSGTTVLRVQLPRKFDNFDEAGAPGALGSIAQGNLVQYFIFGPGLPTGGVLKYQGRIDSYAPQIAENGEESLTVTLTPLDAAVADQGLLGDVTFGNPNDATTYVDPVTIFNYWFSIADSDTGLPYAYPLRLDPSNPASSGNSVQYTFSNEPLSSIWNTVDQMLPANWFWRVNGDATTTLNVPPVTAQHLFVIGQHIVAPQYTKDWKRLKNVIQVIGTGISVGLTSAIASGVSISSLAVDATPIALSDGQQIIVNDGGNPTYTFFVHGQVATGSTTIPIYTDAPTATFPAGTLVSLTVSATATGSDLATFGKRVAQLSDNRIADANTALIIADSLLTQYDTMVLRTKIRVIDYRGDANWGLGYDIETIQPGDTCQLINPSNSGNPTSDVAIIFGIIYNFDSVDLELGYFVPEDNRDIISLRSQFQDFTLGR